MDKGEVERHLFGGRSHSIVVDVRETSAPGVVRTLTIHRDNKVTLEFDTADAYVSGDIEGWGPKYVAHYDSLDAIIADLEEFLGQPIDAWTNRSASPYVPSNLAAGRRRMETLRGVGAAP